MTTYRISGVWKKGDGVITHYAIHTVLEKSITRAEKVSKARAVELTEEKENVVTTWVWNYEKSF